MLQRTTVTVIALVVVAVCCPLVVRAKTAGTTVFWTASEHLPTPTPAPGNQPPIPPPPPPAQPTPPLAGDATGRDYTPPDAPTDVSLASDGVVVTMTWVGPGVRDVERVEILRNMGGTTAVRSEPIAILARGVQRHVDSEVRTGERYTYRLRVRDQSDNVSLTEEHAIIVPLPLPSRAEVPSLFTHDVPGAQAFGVPTSDSVLQLPPVPKPAPSIPEPTAPLPTAPQVRTLAPNVYNPNDRDALLSALAVPRDLNAERRARAVIEEEVQQGRIVLNELEVVPITNYLAYGNSLATRRLGSGERLAILRDAVASFGWARGRDIRWDEIDRLARGEPPQTRHLARERERIPVVLRAWTSLRRSPPNFADSMDALAWSALLYPLRFSRDLSRERVALRRFRDRFARMPTTSLEWALVRVAAHEMNE